MRKFWTDDRIRHAAFVYKECRDYHETCVILNGEWGEQITPEALRKALYRYSDRIYDDAPTLKNIKTETAPIEVVRAVQSGATTLEDLCNRLDVSPQKARRIVAMAQGRGYDLQIETDQHITFRRDSAEVEATRLGKIPAGKELCFAALGDTHCGSEEYAKAELVEFVKYAYDCGARHVFHVGDVFDGCYHRGHQYELAYSGFEKQCQVALETFPRHNGLNWHTITGNHDINSYWKACGMDPGIALQNRARAMGREDIHHHGAQQARLLFGNGDDAFRVELYHPTKGATYARSYPVQKYAESLEGGSKPDIAIIGHYHCYSVNSIRNICCIQPGCFQWQTPYLQSKHLEPAVGGVICWVSRWREGWKIRHEWVQYWQHGKVWEVV